MQIRKLPVPCECPGHETIGSLRVKIDNSAAALKRALDMKPLDLLAFSVARVIPCSPCKGLGYTEVANGPDDSEKQRCPQCNGSGRAVSANF
jgi:hypothetical protein